jgi:hypothetical protein
MTQEDKELLLKDLCARLPYGVKYQDRIDKGVHTLTLGIISHYERFIPYLRPMSSMTEEEANEWVKASNMKFDMEDGFLDAYDAHLSIDWLNEHHFDYRGLIPMGLALEAPKDMYNN